jgi:oligopeptide transport system permease protein
VRDYRLPYRLFDSAERAMSHMDGNRDGEITEKEYPGTPELYTFWLGTDKLGRDVLTRLLYGVRLSIIIGLVATFISFVIGVTWGSVAGYFGGFTDSVMMRIVDVLYGLPFMFIVILLIVIAGRSTVNLFIALGCVQWLTMARVVRGQVISLKEREFVEAAVAIGVPKFKIIFRHLLPNTIGPVIVYSTLMVPAIILEEAFLSFLGLGVQPPHSSLGLLINYGKDVIESAPWLVMYPGLILALTLFSMNFVGDGIRDALDPQMSKD